MVADLHFENISGASYKNSSGRIEVDPTASRWVALWK
jgi:hypothetical protein